MIRERFADLIRESGRSQIDLAKASGIGQSTISSILTGQRTDLRAEVVARLGLALGLSPTALGRELYAGIEPEKIPKIIPDRDWLLSGS